MGHDCPEEQRNKGLEKIAATVVNVLKKGLALAYTATQPHSRRATIKRLRNKDLRAIRDGSTPTNSSTGSAWRMICTEDASVRLFLIPGLLAIILLVLYHRHPGPGPWLLSCTTIMRLGQVYWKAQPAETAKSTRCRSIQGASSWFMASAAFYPFKFVQNGLGSTAAPPNNRSLLP